MTKSRQIIVFDNQTQMVRVAVQSFVRAAEEAIRKRGRFVCALSGGKTPIAFYKELSKTKDVALWERIHIFLVDERFVAPHHRDSNFAMIQKTLFEHIPIPAHNICPIPTHTKNLDSIVENYEARLDEFFGPALIPVFDFIFLGMGEDGHTASLFPGTKALRETKRWVVSCASKNASHKRITLSLPVLCAANYVFFLIQGVAKAAMIKKILQTKSSLPAALVKPVNGQLSFLLDKQAASKLSTNRFV